jgi:hypothetical protein
MFLGISANAQTIVVKADIEVNNVACEKDSTDKYITLEKIEHNQYHIFQSFVTRKCHNQFVVSKQSGQFRMLVNSPNYNADTITFKVKDQTREINLGEIVLSQKMIFKELNEVTIVGNKKQFVKIDADKTTYLVKDNPLLSSGSMAEAIKKLPGVMISPTGDINFHGKSTTIYIDGVPCSLSGQDLNNYIQSLPATTIDKIELITNPGASYEANTNGGIINIITRTSSFKNFSGTLDFDYGINECNKNSYIPSIMLNGNVKAINWQLQTGYGKQERNTSDFVNRAYTSFSPAVLFFQNNVSDINDRNFYFRPMVNFRLNKTSHLIINYNLDNTNNEATVFSNSYTQNLAQPIIYTNSYKNTNNNSNNEFVAKYKTDLDTSGKSLQITGYYLLYNKQAMSKSTQEQADSTLYSINNMHLKINNFYLKYDFELPFESLKFQLNTGGKLSTFTANDLGKYHLNDSVSTIFDNPEYTTQLNFNYQETDLALYAELQKQLGKLHATAGLRMENIHYRSKVLENDTIIKASITNIFPTVHLLYKLTPDVNLVSGYTRKISMPFYTQLDPNNNSYFDRYMTSSGNQYLKPTFYNNYTCEITAFDYFEMGAIYSQCKNINISTYTTSDQSLITNQTFLNYKGMRKFDVYASFPVPLNFVTQGKSFFKQPMNLDKMSYLFFDVEWHHQKIQDFPYVGDFKPYWIVDCSLQLLLPYKFKLFADYTFISKGTALIHQLDEPMQSFMVDLSRKFFKEKLGITLEAIAPSVDNLSDPTANLNTHYTNTYDSRFFRIKLTYNFGTYKNKEETEIKTEKKPIGDSSNHAIN